jgi:hypothetical protein
MSARTMPLLSLFDLLNVLRSRRGSPSIMELAQRIEVDLVNRHLEVDEITVVLSGPDAAAIAKILKR